MDRTKVFVSYSHADRSWMDRLQTHLAVLERQKLVHVWSDVRIEAGAEWEKQIDAALTEARVAVLLLTPNYLASEFIWHNEIPPIMKHQKAGMLVLPLVARPCAWRLEEQLARLKARPEDGRPLSIGTDAQVDLDLATFTYELAKIVGRMNADAALEWQHMMSRTAPPEPSVPTPPNAMPSSPPPLAQVWRGRYQETDMEITLRIERRTGADFTGKIEYDHGAVTEVRGRVDLAGGLDAGVTFREVRIVREGRRPVSLDGEYRAVVDSNLGQMSGGWFSGEQMKGEFVLMADPEVAAARRG